MLLRFPDAMRLSRSRHRAQNTNTKTLPGPWDETGSIRRIDISLEELVCVSQHRSACARALLSFLHTGIKPLRCCLSTRKWTAVIDGLQFPVALSLAICGHHADTMGPVELMGNNSQLGYGKLQGCKAEKHLHSTHIAEH